MGWGTEFKAEIFLNKQTYPTIQDVDIKIEELEEDNLCIRQTISMYSSANIKDLTDEEGGTLTIEQLQFILSNYFSTLEQNIVLIYQLKLLKEFFNTKIE